MLYPLLKYILVLVVAYQTTLFGIINFVVVFDKTRLSITNTTYTVVIILTSISTLY